MRTFVDSRGLIWSAYETPARRVVFGDEVVEERAPQLTFELTLRDRTVCRKLARYPARWYELRDEELEVLCNEAGPPPSVPYGAFEGDLRDHLNELST